MTTTILVPGAWMGGWIWEPTVQILRQHGIDAETITLENGDVGLGEQVRGLIHVGSFLPVNGHSLLDAWGPTPQPAPRNAPILTPPGPLARPNEADARV